MSKSCCTWPRIIFTFVLIAAAAVLIWLFVPFDKAVANVLPTYGNATTTIFPKTPAPAPIPASSSPAPAATSTPSTPYTFIQCTTNDDCCQGLDGICDYKIHEVLFAGAHNSMASVDKGFTFDANQQYETKLSLDAGFRDIAVDMCNCEGAYVLCHGFCQLGRRDPVELFTEIVTFLNNNPSEIIVINMELNSDADQEVTLTGIFDVLNQVTGMTDMMYQHPDPTAEWPTLRSLRNAGTRIIFFHYNGPNCDAGDCPAGMNYYWDSATDSQYSFSDLAALQDTTSSCPIGRGANRGTYKFFAVNSFVTPASQSVAETLNSKDFAETRIDACSAVNSGLKVSTYYVDFWNSGDLPRLVQERNAALVQR